MRNCWPIDPMRLPDSSKVPCEIQTTWEIRAFLCDNERLRSTWWERRHRPAIGHEYIGVHRRRARGEWRHGPAIGHEYIGVHRRRVRRERRHRPAIGHEYIGVHRRHARWERRHGPAIGDQRTIAGD